MKTVFALLILFCGIALPALAELTDADLDKIRLIVNEELKTEITAVKQELKAEIASSEKRMKDHIDLNIQNVDKRLGTYNWVIYVLTPLIVASIGIPTAIMAWRSMKDSNQEKKIQELTQEIETLKQIINP